MGRGIYFVVTAAILGMASVTFVGQRTRFESDKRRNQHDEASVARDVARSGLERGISDVRRLMMDAPRLRRHIRAAGGVYDVGITTNRYGDMMLTAAGTSGGATHKITTNLLFETPVNAAVTLRAQALSVVSNGAAYVISGIDQRMPSAGSGNGFLRPAHGIALGKLIDTDPVREALHLPSVVGSGGTASIVGDDPETWFDDLYLAARTHPGLVRPAAPFARTYGTADNPAIVIITGDFAPKGKFSGNGLLIVEDGDFTVGDQFGWEGLVLVRKRREAETHVALGGNASVFGAFAAVEPSAPDSSCLAIPFEISGLRTVPDVAFNVRFDVIGAAISAGGAYDMPVTVQVHTGGNVATPWGTYDAAIGGNVNTGERFVFEPDGAFPAGTALTVSARSWRRSASADGTDESHWSVAMEQNSAEAGRQLLVLRDGDDVPEIDGYLDQSSAADFVAEYIDDDGKIKLARNQSIYLFELGTTDSESAAWDMQDLVVLATMVRANTGCSLTRAMPGSLTFAVGGRAQLHYSAEAVATVGRFFPIVEARSRVVIASQHETTVVSPR